MARSNATTKACFKAAMGISAEETTKLGERADKYATTDIAADWASAVQDMIEEYLVQYNALEKAVKEAKEKATKQVTADAPVTLYHGTGAALGSASELRLPTNSGQLGIHFGSQATAGTRNSGTVLSAKVRLGNTIRLPDLGLWSAKNVIPELKKLYSTDAAKMAAIRQFENDNPELMRQTNSHDDAKLRALFKELGVDSVVYTNAYEGVVRMKGAAFRNIETGDVVNTGPVHNREKLPGGHNSDLAKWEAGFVDVKGKFYNRDEAAMAVGKADGPLRTEDYSATKGLNEDTGSRLTSGGEDSYIVLNKASITAENAGDQLSKLAGAPISRRSVLVAAMAAAAGPASAGEVTLGKAKALTSAVQQQMTPAIAKILRGNGKTNADGAGAVRKALEEIAANGPAEVRALAQMMVGLLPKSGFFLTVDDVGQWNAHGAVRMQPIPHLMLFTADGRTGLTYETFLHEALHMIVAAKYSAISRGGVQSNYAKLNLSDPAAMPELKQFIDVWREFKSAVDLKSITDKELHLSVSEAMSNPDEFFVRALTEPRFQKLLSGIEYKGKTLLQRFVAWVKESLFGFSKEGTVPSWLDAALMASNDLLTASGKDPSSFKVAGAFSDAVSKNSLKEETPTQFSKTVDAAIQQTADAANSQVADSVEQVRSMMSEKTKDTWATITDAFRKFAPAFLSNYQLVEQYGKKFKAKSLERYVGLQQKMTQERTQQAMKFHNIAVEWDKLAEGTKERLNKLMLRATLDQIHPDEAFTPGQNGTPNGHLTEADRAKYDQLRVQYNALGGKAQKVYQDAKQALADQWKDRREAYRKLVDYTFSGRMADAMKRNDLEAYAKLEQDSKDALAAYDKQLDQLKGPYFPLMRFGTYLAIGESSELVALKDKIKDAVGDERRKLEAQLESMKKDPKHYEVSAHESRGQLNRATRALRDRGLVPREDMTDQNLDGVSRDSARIVAEIGHMVTANFDGDIAQQVNDGLANVYLRSLPEMHALRREAHRKGIEGANPDMLRAFASAGQSGSFYQSRLRHAPEMADAMFQMKREAKGNIDMQHIHREMEKRMALDMQFKETPVQDLVASASWVYHLGMSPSNWVLNATQPWLVSAPMMAGKFGMARASAELGRAYTDAAKIMKDARFKGDKIDWWSGISEDSLTNRDERKALRALMERGIVDEGLQHELNMFADGKSRGLAAFNRWMGWGNQQVELVNRTTTALAAFRLATKSGMKYDEALDYAYKTTLNSQFDYSQEGTARFMREGGGVPMAKLVFQFRKFQQGMLYALGSNIRKLANPEERKEAAYTLAYLSATSGLVAGATGLPFAAVVYGIANAFLDDDDPEGDAETQFANWLYDVTGDKKAADVLRKGLPALWGWDVSKRVGMGDVASLFPMGRFDGKTGQEFGGQVAMAAMGPAAGLAARMYDGSVLIGEGEFQRGSEKMLPKVAADMMKALRYGTEGMSDGKGNPTGTQYDAIDIASKAFGFNPVKESDYYEGTAAVKNTQSAVKDRIGRIGNQFKEAVRDGDMADVREAIAKFNEDHPENPITPKQELQWRKDARESGKNRTEAGVKMGNKKDGIYNPVARFAQ